MTPTEVAKVHFSVNEMWPRMNPPLGEDRLPLVLTMWANVLAGIDAADALLAVESLLAEGREFPPTVGQIRVRALELGQAAGDEGAVPTGIEAWGEILELIQRRGWMQAPAIEDYSHPVVGEMVKHLGGWMRVCESETGMADRAHFLREYDAVATRHRDHMTTPAKALAERRETLPVGSMRELGS